LDVVGDAFFLGLEVSGSCAGFSVTVADRTTGTIINCSVCGCYLMSYDNVMIGFGPHGYIELPFQCSRYWDSCSNNYECNFIINIIINDNYNVIITIFQRDK
jgi:hypothetical protein